MMLTFEFFIGLFAVYFIGYLIAAALEKKFHINLDESELNDLDFSKTKKYE
jgi:hypothetical protein